MCGKLRICSAASLLQSQKGRPSSKSHEGNSGGSSGDDSTDEKDDGTAHIIPRQNKGLCTACDVTVWVVTSTGMEIKWCKGCKNFRPWAAFGDKGLATKCVRCRDRQREKYAAQNKTRSQRSNRSDTGSAGSSTSPTSSDSRLGGSPSSYRTGDNNNDLAAARNLQNLIQAAAATSDKV
jgi:Zn-finger nucleic acid-binding protein